VKRTVSTPHLVLGIIFAGIAALWFIGQGTDAKISDTAPGFPLVLIGAGAIGLVASLANARARNRLATEATADSDLVDDEVDQVEDQIDGHVDDTEATTVINEENR